ncbi:MAG: NAD(P)-dependent oxidoreductase [Patescibacteria group bacterium]
MRALVIGGTGFIGEYLCRELISRGVEVVTVCLPGLLPEEKIRGVSYEEMNLNTDFLKLTAIIPTVDTLILAIQPDAIRLKNIISLTANCESLKKIVYLSTVLVYPDSEDIQAESAISEPETDYEKEKFNEEMLLREFATGREWRLAICRLGNVYGDVKNKGVVNNILLALFDGRPFILNGNGENWRDYIYVGDVARQLAGLIAWGQAEGIGIYNICTGVGYTLNQVIGRIEEISGRRVEITPGERNSRQKSVVGDNQKLAKILNFEPSLGLTEGLEATYNNYLKHYKLME